MKPSAVLFDCDGVVVDSEGATFALLGREFSSYGLDLTRQVMEEMFLGGTMQGVFQAARGLGADLPDNWVEVFYEKLYTELALGTDLVAGIEDVLQALDAASVPYAIGSNGSEAKMKVTLGQHPDLLARFGGHVYSGQSLGAPKPAPDLYLHAARQLGVDPSRAVVVEDSPNGAKAARAAEMRCMGYAPHGNAKLAAVGAELFSDMRQLPALLGL
jgi:HAD superfamily hydrolase (TIGR01509 family)